MEPFLTRRPSQLSGGEKQRAVLMRALARKADVVLMDEPFSNIEACFREELIQNLLHVKEACHSTFLYATHDLTEAMRLSDRIALLQTGKLLQCSAPAAFYSEPNSLDVFRFMNPGKALVIPCPSSRGYPAEVRQLGLTSSDLHLSRESGQLKATIKTVRFDENGDYRLQLLLANGQEIAFSVPQTDFRPGQEIYLDWDVQNELAFSASGLIFAKGK